jgi:hypothetical protein
MACLTSNYDLYNQDLNDSIAFSLIYVTGWKCIMLHENEIFQFGILRAVLTHLFVCIFSNVDGNFDILVIE